jgi:hypothetical protein
MRLKDKIKTLVWVFFNQRLFRALIFFAHNGYLRDVGWIKSFLLKEPVNDDGKPIPWVTYSFLEFIKSRLHDNFRVYEYGSGNSTLFYSQIVGSVNSVEHNKEWFNRIRNKVGPNVEIKFQELDINGKYCRSILEQGGVFDIVIIDAEDRVNCLINCVSKLSETGVIVLDDSDRTEYMEGINFLVALGFKKIDFWGISPGFSNNKATTIFYKNNNCLGI